MSKATSASPRARLHFPLALVLALAFVAPASAQQRSTLAVESGGTRVTWWRSEQAPMRWRVPDVRVLDAVRWTRPRPGLRLGELTVLVNGGLLRLEVVVVRLALADYDVALQQATSSGRAAWRVEDAPADAALAVNAGQFTEASPWGWLVVDGRVLQRPGTGPLSAGVAWDGHALSWLEPAGLLRSYADARWLDAFQSYPVLLRRGVVPRAVGEGVSIDGAHRDARLALGLHGDTLLLALTRFRGAGSLLERLPAGLTVAETAALLGALGASDAVMLDGGLSAQLLVRNSEGAARVWPGTRRVPLGLVLRERPRQR